ncbi:MAG: ABC transporter permease [Bacteroidaceae bacterium]|nr:ABC transporter permease [Bacteroidaceae bacterium]
MKTLKYALRFLVRSKSYTLINLLGLAFSLACSIILMRYIHRELTVDTHCVDRENIYGVETVMEGNRSLSSVDNERHDSICIDESTVEARARIIMVENEYVVYQGHRYIGHVIAADSTYFDLFPFQAIQGNLSLSNPESALLMEGFAKRIFGKENPIGKVLRYSNGKDIVVAGVLKEPTNKRSLQFDMILPTGLCQSWGRVPTDFLRFTSDDAIQQANLSGQYPRYVNPHATQWDTRKFTFSLIPLKEAYWNQSLMYQTAPIMGVSGNSSHLYILSAICFLILLAGVINFVNLYLAIMQKRSKIYMLRRVFGADGKALFKHIYTENFLLIASALLVAWLLIEISQVPIGQMLDTTFSYTPFDAWISMGILGLLPGIVSVYAFWQCRRKLPIASIRGIEITSHRIGSRMLLLFTQYVMTFLLVIVAFYFNNHLRHLLNTPPGFRTEGIIEAKLIYESNDSGSYNAEYREARKKAISHIDSQLNQCPDIEQWTAIPWSIIGFDYRTNYSKGEGETYQMNQFIATPEFFEIFDIPVLEGIIPKVGDDDRLLYQIANRSAMKVLGYDSCKNAILYNEDMRRLMPEHASSTISGVVEDYFDRHISLGIRPTIFNITNYYSGEVYQIACRPEKVEAVIDYLKNVEKEVYGASDFEYSLVADKVSKLYQEDKRVAGIYTLFSGIAILIICLGLFGISLFDIRQRYREIAIRKVNGAGLKDLYQLLFRKYLTVLGASFVVAAPLAYYLIYRYTADFAVKAPISIGIFALALLLISLISMGTLWWQIRKAANIDPATVMKTE